MALNKMIYTKNVNFTQKYEVGAKTLILYLYQNINIL